MTAPRHQSVSLPTSNTRLYLSDIRITSVDVYDTCKLIKDMIRMGMRFVPNHLLAYRFFIAGALAFNYPPGFYAHPGQVAGLQAMWLSHESRCQPRVLLYLHGGGYVIGSNQTHLELACRIAEAAEAQVFAGISACPRKPFYPAALDDALFAYRYLLSQGYATTRSLSRAIQRAVV